MKQRRFVKRYVETGNGAEAARAAFDAAPGSAAQLAHATLSKPAVREAVTELLDAEGLSDDKLRTIHANLLALYADPDPRNKAIALRALDMAYKLTGAYAPERHEVTGALALLTLAECDHFARTGEWPARLAPNEAPRALPGPMS